MIKLNGRKLADERLNRLAKEVDAFAEKTHHRPRLDIVSVGDNNASEVYVRNKIRAAQTAHIIAVASTHHYPTGTPVKDIMHCLLELSYSHETDGIILQLPLPAMYSKENERLLIQCIVPEKDVDGLTYLNAGRLASGGYIGGLMPCTPLGIMNLLEASHIDLAGRDVVIINRSNLVGKPLFHMMTAANATVTMLHSKSSELAKSRALADADIIVSAVGQENFIHDDDISIGQVLIDVSINRNSEGKLCGDFAEDCYENCYAYTPVPGGVGPMTVCSLMENTFKAAMMKTYE